jgi:two-component system, response regulator RegA
MVYSAPIQFLEPVMKVVALLVQPSGVEWDMADMAEMTARLPGLIPLESVAPGQVPDSLSLSWAPLPAAAPGGPGKSLRELEREFLERVLAEYKGNKSAAAKSLKMHRRTLQRKLARGS